MSTIEAAVMTGPIRGGHWAGLINDEIWDLLPSYISHRMLQHGRPVTTQTLHALVDEVMLPSLTRHPNPSYGAANEAPSSRGTTRKPG